jgi:hypothetical protein
MTKWVQPFVTPLPVLPTKYTIFPGEGPFLIIYLLPVHTGAHLIFELT